MNKKRHIGNDIVCVVFLDNTGAVFNPSWIRSHFIHAYIVVQHITGSHGQPLYRVSYHGNHLMWLDVYTCTCHLINSSIVIYL